MAKEQVDRIIEEFEQLSVDELKAVSERLLESKRLSLDDLKAVSERILEEIEDREWDRLLSSPEGIADAEQERAKTMEAIATGDIIEYIPGKSLEELFHAKSYRRDPH